MRAWVWPIVVILVVAVIALAACAETARLSVEEGTGPDPELPPPNKSLFPTVNVAEATGWPPEKMPVTAAGTHVTAFADQLDHPRWLYVLPNGDVLVAETNAPARPDDGKGIRAKIARSIMKKAGAGVPSANRITLLRDADRDGFAETTTVFADKLNSPFGMALVGNDFFVANTDAIVKYRYESGATAVAGEGTRLAELPGGDLNHHWTKSLIANQDGSKLYVGVGSNSNVAENGMEQEVDRAAILEFDIRTGERTLFASGLRNPVGLAWEPVTGALWTTVNERDEIGSDLVPDYMTSVRRGGFYGWPYSYYGRHVDERVEPPRPDLVETAIVPDYALGPHTASLGLAASQGTSLPAQFQQGMFVGQHGSWNRDPPSGYKVIFVPFKNGKPAGRPIDVLTGFLGPDDTAYGRPVGVALDKQGALLVADDVGNVVWRVTAAR